MTLLLVDNGSDTLLELRALCDDLGYDVTTIHCKQLADIDANWYDLVVLSGGYWYDDELEHLETYADELALIRTTNTPLIGICLGMQLMHVAYNGIVPLLEVAQTGLQEITLTSDGQKTLGLPKHITVHKNHTRGVISTLPHFHIFGLSEGHLEIMQHTNKPQIGVQFHPELSDTTESVRLMQACLRAITPPPLLRRTL